MSEATAGQAAAARVAQRALVAAERCDLGPTALGTNIGTGDLLLGKSYLLGLLDDQPDNVEIPIAVGLVSRDIARGWLVERTMSRSTAPANGRPELPEHERAHRRAAQSAYPDETQERYLEQHEPTWSSTAPCSMKKNAGWISVRSSRPTPEPRQVQGRYARFATPWRA